MENLIEGRIEKCNKKREEKELEIAFANQGAGGRVKFGSRQAAGTFNFELFASK